MKRWMIGGFVGAFIGVSIYLMLTKKTESEPAAAPAKQEKTEPEGTMLTPPVVLPNVVVVADLNPLLDPPAKPITGAPFDADSGLGTVPIAAPPAPARIPPAID